MYVKTRTSAQGTEFWNTKEKRSVFVPAGKEPDFEVTEDPKSMIATLHPGEEVKPMNKETNLDEMNTEQLLTLAEQNNIDVPGNMSKEDTIRKHIQEELTAADQE